MTSIAGNSRERWIPYAVIAPALLLIILFKLYPITNTLIDSFIRKGNWSLRNYELVFQDKVFWNSIGVTFKFNIIVTPLQILVSIGMALLVNVRMRGARIFRTVYYLPVTISMTVACILWNLMLNPSNGVVNSAIRMMGGSPQQFFTGVQGIDEELYESARIDGANWWQTTTRITLPLLKNALTFVIISDTTANLLLFAPMFMITNGGPQMSTNVLMYEAYKSSFIYADQARASTLMTVMLMIVAVIVVTQFVLLNRDDGGMTKRKRGGAQ